MRRKSSKQHKKKLTTERVYELICEEHEYNPIVGEAFFETKQFLVSLGYTLPGAVTALVKVEREYDLHLYRRGNDHHHTDNGELVTREFGVTRRHNHREYAKILIYYLSRLRSGMSEEEALKECHEHYDPILAKERGYEPQTVDVAIPLSGRAMYQERLKTCEYCDIEF